MLRRLSIRDFAIIERLDLDLEVGLSAMTGETGAGKSIIVGALNLVLGGRAAADLVRTGCEAAEVSAEFDLPGDPEVARQLAELGAGNGNELLLRRQVRREGRSRAWLNDRPVSVGALGELAGRLVDIAGQHQHQSLLKVENHLLLLDRLGRLEHLRGRVAEHHAELSALNAQRRALIRKSDERREREEFLRFQLNEIDQAAVREDEENELERERDLLRHAESIRNGLNAALDLLDGEGAAVTACSRAGRELERILGHLSEAGELFARLESARLELEDIAGSLAGYARKAKSDPVRLEAIEERLALLSRLLKKHGPTCRDLLLKSEKMRDELARMEHLDADLEQLDQRIREAAQQALKVARALSVKRHAAAEAMDANIEAQLSDLGMKKTRFQVEVRPRGVAGDEDVEAEGEHLSATGIDEVEFLISPNPGEELKPLARIASGGELSRVMLAIKGVLQECDPVETSIFDEVDAGIGGAVAQKVGEKIRELARARQVICITHLPQITAFADRHFRVSKSSSKGRTYTRVESLADAQAIETELARMMAGEAAGEASIRAARELLEHARAGRSGGRKKRPKKS